MRITTVSTLNLDKLYDLCCIKQNTVKNINALFSDHILDIYNNAEDAIKRQADQYDRLIDKIEQISDTYSLYYGEDSYAELDKFYAQQGQIMQNQLDQLTSAYQY